jgi:DNA-binding MarR family transcriptional regulator
MSVSRETVEPGLVDQHRTSPGLLLALLGQQAMRNLKATHDAYDLKPRQFQLLVQLHDDGEVGQRELGELMEIDPSVLVTLLNPLEERGLVARTRSTFDRRKHTVALTAAGRRHLAEAVAAQRAAEDALFAALDRDEREQLRQLLLRLDTGGSCPPPACDGG